MRIVLAVTALLIAVSATQPAQADPYKWCAVYAGNAMDGSKACWFTTLEQCQATVTGLAGFCQPNTFTSEPAAASAQRSKKRASTH
jgi:hypothetical protein